jgi:predicted metal-binding protein
MHSLIFINLTDLLNKNILYKINYFFREIYMYNKNKIEKFNFLKDKALKLGAVDCKIISVDNIYVENRVTLKCHVGCVGYGKKLTCPPYVPKVDEFRKILNEYDYALLLKFKSPAKADHETVCSIYKNWLDPNVEEDLKAKAGEFWSDYFDYSEKIHHIMLELEKEAFNSGHSFAMAFVNGSCRLCKSCNLKGGICIHPNLARIPEHAVGINMKKTAEEAGMELKFPFVDHPEPMTIMLID